MSNIIALRNKMLGIVIASLLPLGTASAVTMDGSASIGALGASKNGANLLTSTIVTPTSEFWGAGTGDFLSISAFTPITGSALVLSNPVGFTWSSVYGSFLASSFTIIQHTANDYDVYLLGTFTPAGPFSGFTAGPASERLSLNFTGDAVSWGATLASPPFEITTPEPMSAVILGTSMLVLGMARRRR